MLLPSRLTLGLAIALLAALIGWATTASMQRTALRLARADLAVASGNIAALEAAIGDQNAAIERAAAAGRRRQEAAAAAIARVPATRSHVVRPLSEPGRGGSVTDRFEDVDRRFMEALR